MMTGAGIILGTAAYMAPEQARGRAVDKRADIWAFGAVLFEMLTGTRAFEGEDIADTLGNVMKVEPNWQRVPASVPPRVERVLRSCLQKKATQRLDSAQAVRLILDGDFDTVAPHIPNEASQPAPPAARPLWRRALPFAVTALVVAAVALGAGWQLKPADPGPVIRARCTSCPGRGRFEALPTAWRCPLTVVTSSTTAPAVCICGASTRWRIA
jgi:rubredoxin